jgi:hypothetical protein
MTSVYEIPPANFDKANNNLSQARAMLNVLAVSGDDNDGFTSQKDAIQVIHAAVQMVDEAVKVLDSSFTINKMAVRTEPETSGM